MDLYTKLLNSSGGVAGKWVEKFNSWTFPLDQYFEFVNRMKNLELKNKENLELERLPQGIETYIRNDNKNLKGVSSNYHLINI